MLRVLAKHILPAPFRKRGRQWWSRVGLRYFGGFWRLQPVSRVFGLDRGLPIDRFYIESFLASCQADVAGRALEVADSEYTCRFGGTKVVRADVLHAVPGNPQATVVGDLATGHGIPKGAYDCLILTQTLLCIFDCRAAVRNAYEALKPKGVLLVTVPGISQISRYDADRWGDYWRFTEQSAGRLFGEIFGPENVTVQSYGNVLVACAVLQGLAVHELTEKELSYRDPDYPVLIAVRAVKDGLQ